MSDLIDRQSALDALKKCHCGGEDSCGEPWIYEEHAFNAIKQLPPAQHEPSQVARDIARIVENEQDMRVIAQPEIIRCRECKFASGDSRICMKFDHSPIGELDFCSFAERREVTT